MEVNFYLPKTKLVARLHAYKVIHGEEPFELQSAEGTVSEIVQKLEYATPRKGERQTQDASTSSSNTPIEPVAKAATKPQAIVYADEEMYDFEGTTDKRSDDEEWKGPQQAQKRRKVKKKIDQHRIAQSTDDKQGASESQGKSIQDMGAAKSQDRSGQGSGKLQDTLSYCKTFP